MNVWLEDQYRNAITTRPRRLKWPASRPKVPDLIRRIESIVEKGNAVALAKERVGNITEGGWKSTIPVGLYFPLGQDRVKVG